jgi:membrane protein YdbS with pleckstrin-like domain
MPDIFVSPPLPSVPTTVPESSSVVIPRCHPLSAFIYKPQAIHFQTQGDKEHIILLLRRHWVTNIPWIIAGIILAIIPVITVPVVLQSQNASQIPSMSSGILLIIWYLFTFTYVLVNFLLWYFTVSIVTEERIIDIDFINILSKRFSETRVGRVEDVTEHMGGFLRAFFNYGDVIVQTAGTHEEFEFDSIPRPSDVVRIINELVGNEEDEGETE